MPSLSQNQSWRGRGGREDGLVCRRVNCTAVTLSESSGGISCVIAGRPYRATVANNSSIFQKERLAIRRCSYWRARVFGLCLTTELKRVDRRTILAVMSKRGPASPLHDFHRCASVANVRTRSNYLTPRSPSFISVRVPVSNSRRPEEKITERGFQVKTVAAGRVELHR